jgi:hypothetical protein
MVQESRRDDYRFLGLVTIEKVDQTSGFCSISLDLNCAIFNYVLRQRLAQIELDLVSPFISSCRQKLLE